MSGYRTQIVHRIENFYRERSRKALWLGVFIGLAGATLASVALVFLDYEPASFAVASLLCCAGASLLGTGGLIARSREQLSGRLMRSGLILFLAGVAGLAITSIRDVLIWLFWLEFASLYQIQLSDSSI